MKNKNYIMENLRVKYSNQKNDDEISIIENEYTENSIVIEDIPQDIDTRLNRYYMPNIKAEYSLMIFLVVIGIIILIYFLKTWKRFKTIARELEQCLNESLTYHGISILMSRQDLIKLHYSLKTCPSYLIVITKIEVEVKDNEKIVAKLLLGPITLIRDNDIYTQSIELLEINYSFDQLSKLKSLIANFRFTLDSQTIFKQIEYEKSVKFNLENYFENFQIKEVIPKNDKIAIKCKIPERIFSSIDLTGLYALTKLGDTDFNFEIVETNIEKETNLILTIQTKNLVKYHWVKEPGRKIVSFEIDLIYTIIQDNCREVISKYLYHQKFHIDKTNIHYNLDERNHITTPYTCFKIVPSRNYKIMIRDKFLFNTYPIKIYKNEDRADFVTGEIRVDFYYLEIKMKHDDLIRIIDYVIDKLELLIEIDFKYQEFEINLKILFQNNKILINDVSYDFPYGNNNYILKNYYMCAENYNSINTKLISTDIFISENAEYYSYAEMIITDLEIVLKYKESYCYLDVNCFSFQIYNNDRIYLKKIDMEIFQLLSEKNVYDIYDIFTNPIQYNDSDTKYRPVDIKKFLPEMKFVFKNNSIEIITEEYSKDKPHIENIFLPLEEYTNKEHTCKWLEKLKNNTLDNLTTDKSSEPSLTDN